MSNDYVKTITTSDGTKLYLHKITISGTDKIEVGENKYSNAILNFITNTSSNITHFGDVYDNVISFKMSQYGPIWNASEVNILSMRGMGGTWCDFYCLTNGGSSLTLKILSGATLSDTVTEL